MGPTQRARLLGIDPARTINPHLSAQALLEQIQLPREHLEVLVEAVRETSPFRADQLSHLSDSYFGSAPTAHQQIGMFVRVTHPVAWARIYARASALLLERQAQRFADPPAVTAAVERAIHRRPTLSEILEKEPNPPKDFSPFDITPRDLNQLPSVAKKLEAQVLIYRAIEGFALSVIKTMEGLEENDYGSLEEVLNRVHDWQWNILPMADKPLSQIGNSAGDLIRLLGGPLELMKDKAISWKDGIARLQRNFSVIGIKVAEPGGFWTSPARQKYAVAMAQWLKKNSETSRWEDGKWKLTATKKGKGVGKTWPPDLNNPALQTYLGLLGWQVEVEPQGENILITVDFGNWRVE